MKVTVTLDVEYDPDDYDPDEGEDQDTELVKMISSWFAYNRSFTAQVTGRYGTRELYIDENYGA